MAEALAELGANVVVCARKAERCEEAASALTAAYGVETLGLGCDVRDRAQIDAVVAATLERFGADRHARQQLGHDLGRARRGRFRSRPGRR